MTISSASPEPSGASSTAQARRLAAVDTAAAYLSSCGYRILDRPWQSGGGQLDVVAADRAALVVAVVKTRTRARYGRPAGVLSPGRIRHLRRLAVRWMDEHGSRYGTIWVDVAVVWFEGTGGYTIEHHQGVA